MRDYYVYIMTNNQRVLYTGVTNDLVQLAYYEIPPDVNAAITREKQIKGWVRKRKVALIESVNPDWRDLSKDWVDSSLRSE